MNKMFCTLLAITIVCFSHSVYGMENTDQTNKTIQIPKDIEKILNAHPCIVHHVKVILMQ
jgi:hypothetical protein